MHGIMTSISAPISLGELVDKISILEIKAENIADSVKLANIRKELDLLQALALSLQVHIDPNLASELRRLNSIIWRNEDAARQLLKMDLSDEILLSVARIAIETYQANTSRAAIKLKINQLFLSDIVEEKSYLGDDQ